MSHFADVCAASRSRADCGLWHGDGDNPVSRLLWLFLQCGCFDYYGNIEHNTKTRKSLDIKEKTYPAGKLERLLIVIPWVSLFQETLSTKRCKRLPCLGSHHGILTPPSRKLPPIQWRWPGRSIIIAVVIAIQPSTAVLERMFLARTSPVSLSVLTDRHICIRVVGYDQTLTVPVFVKVQTVFAIAGLPATAYTMGWYVRHRRGRRSAAGCLPKRKKTLKASIMADNLQDLLRRKPHKHRERENTATVSYVHYYRGSVIICQALFWDL